MKAVLSNRIYLNVTEAQRDLIDRELTYKIPTYNPLDPPLIIKNMARVRKDMITIPSGREDLIDDDYEVVDKRVLIPVEFPEFQYDLRPSQEEVYQKVEDRSEEHTSELQSQ